MQLRLLALAALALTALAGPVEESTLTVDRLSVSLSRGGSQQLTIDLGPAYANHRYLVAGSASGTFPGTLQEGIRVPLNYDVYSELVLARANGANYAHFSGYLDSQGRATARMTMPASSKGQLAGSVYHHAAVVIDPKTSKVVTASTPVEVLLLP